MGRPSDRKRVNVRDGVSAASNSLLARLAVPDADRVSLDSNLAAEGASVAGMLGHFHLLDLWEGLNHLLSTVAFMDPGRDAPAF